jgi:hypothetical protein
MIGKKINQLATELAPVSTDLTIIGDPDSGVSKKITLAQLGAIFSGAVSFYTNLASFPVVGDINVIYCAKDTQKLYLWSGSAYVEVFPSQALLNTYQLRSEKGVSNGYASLDSGGKVPISQLPSSIMEYKGTWNAATNTPTLANGTGDTGDVYICNVAGTVNFGAGPLTFAVGDYVIYSGSIWQRSSGAVGTVTSVAVSRSGDALAITGSPVTTSGTINIGFAGTSGEYINGAGNRTTFPTLLSSVGLSMPSAFNVANSPLTANGTIAVTGAGNATQYVRGDGQLATLPTNGGGGGASVSYYLNGSINQGTIGGVTYYEMNKTPIIGAGTDFTRSSNGYIASFLTDANDPALLNIPAGNFNFETYFQASSGGGSPTFYIELYKYDGTTFTLIASNSTNPKLINDGTNIEAYFSALAVPQTTLTLTDRLAVRIYVTTAGRTITMHTENGHLCQVITTFTTGLTALNGLTAQVQYLATGTSGSDFNISSASATHTFNLPTASATNRGALASADWTTFNNKQNALNGTGFVKISGTTISYDNSTYVTIDTFQTITASKTFSVGLSLASAGGTNQITSFVNTNSIHSGSASTNVLGFNNSNNIYFGKGLNNGGVITFNNAAVRFYALPDADGTIALVGGSGVGTVTSVSALTIGTSGTDLSSTVANSTTTPVITLNVPTASATNRGALSSTDWTTFNNKQNALTNPVTGTGTTNYLPKFTGASTIGNSAIYDNSGNIGIGSTVSAAKLGVELSSMVPSPLGISAWDSTVAIFGGTTSTSNALALGYNTTNNAAYILSAQPTVAWRAMWFGASEYKFTVGQGSTPALSINTSGNLGLGVTPSAWLVASGRKAIEIGALGNAMFSNGASDFYMLSNAYTDGTFKYANNGPASSYRHADGAHVWFQAPSGTAGNAISFTQAMTLDASGRLGIGTTSPQANLQVLGTIKVATGNAQGILGLGEANGTTVNVGIWRGAANAPTTDGNFLNLGGYEGINFATGNAAIGSQTTRLTIASTGAATFSSTVAVNGNNLTIQPTTTTTYALSVMQNAGGFLRVGRDTSTGALYGSDYAALLVSSGNYAMIIGTNDTERMRISSGGNVGIGTTSPSYQLDLGGGTTINQRLRLQRGSDDSSQNGLYGWNSITVERTSVTITDPQTDFSIIQKASNGSRTPFYISSAGNVGIGTTSPSYKLDVSGTGRFTSDVIVKTLEITNVGTDATSSGLSTYMRITVNGQNYLIPLHGTP